MTTNMQIFYEPKWKNNHEFWLEFGSLQQNNYHDVHWYNDGYFYCSEVWYFFKDLLINLFKKNRYYRFRCRGFCIYFKGRKTDYKFKGVSRYI